jgi:hypothetical protein
MTSPLTDDEAARMLAERFHEAYERLAPSFGYETRKETRQFDPTTPNGRLMIAVCGELAQHFAQRLEQERRALPTPDTIKAASILLRKYGHAGIAYALDAALSAAGKEGGK